ncbi:hypothetical protein CC78DRAFT_578895 [Lojkania enalia]|uniref:Sensitive to high expression protein 9, mitochondrial n=1 Tax=Lojkania enalia TaxID=147567 RepID=A0A9P4KDB2_9PLEO|nr:hypothetical protein CC78DRAFT_578895 [Didymosphaeria enalia]
MRPLLQHASRLLSANAAFMSPWGSSKVCSTSLGNMISSSSSICLRCQYRSSSGSILQKARVKAGLELSYDRPIQRQFSSSRVYSEKKPTDTSEPQPEPKPLSQETVYIPPTESDAPSKPTTENIYDSGKFTAGNVDTLPQFTHENAYARPKSSSVDVNAPPKSTAENVAHKSAAAEDTVKRVPAEDLPSHREEQRWDFWKRISELMDEVLPKLAVVTQKVNTFTGTDYSGIEALRREIKEQEQLVKARRLAVEEAKRAFDAAHAQQATAQKEVVGLLERKHSWSATDMERYMSLIRAEHVIDQAIREAKDAVLARETELEEARTRLEKRERAQYHEEQIWSDTIRRNSTWVTFGLMGFNILLLLTSLLIIEPWRRRRMVREIKTALEAQRAVPATAVTSPPATQSTEWLQPSPALEATIDEVIEPAGTPLESIAPVAENVPSFAEVEETAEKQKTILDITSSPAAELAGLPEEREVKADMKPLTWKDSIVLTFQDLVSKRYISIRKVDFTVAICSAATAGAVISGALIMLLRL